MNPDLEWQVFYPHAVDRVWRALADPAALVEWLDPGDDLIEYRVLEAVEPHHIVYLWTAKSCTAVVRFELAAAPHGANLRVRMDDRKTLAPQIDFALRWLQSYLAGAVADPAGHTLVFRS